MFWFFHLWPRHIQRKFCLYSPYTNSNHCLPVFIFQHLQALKTGRTGSYLIDVVEKRPYLLNGSGNSLRTSNFHTELYFSYYYFFIENRFLKLSAVLLSVWRV